MDELFQDWCDESFDMGYHDAKREQENINPFNELNQQALFDHYEQGFADGSLDM